MKKSAAAVLVAAVLVIGAVFSVASVDRSDRIRDVDEAAWIFNGAFLDLYLSGDWDNPDWNAFDVYAHHPPLGNYIFGALLYAIGEPVKSMEPRRFWYANSFDIAWRPGYFIEGLYDRVTGRQLVAGRILSALVGWLAAVALMVLAWRLIGPVAGISSYALLLLHPVFRDVATLCSVESLIMLLSVLTVLFSWEMGRSMSCNRPVAALWCLLAGVCFGLFLATKISAIPWIAAVAMAAIAGARGKREIALSLLGIAAVALVAFGLAVLLDPGLHRAPLATTIERIELRFIQVDMQSRFFLWQRIPDIWGRLAFSSYWAFFSSAFAFILFLLALAGVGGRFLCSPVSPDRGRSLVVSLAALSFFMVAATLPLAWVRYVATALPFIALLGGLGSENLRNIAPNWRRLARPRRLAVGSIAGFLVLASILLSFGFRFYGWHEPPAPSNEELRISRMFLFSLKNPGIDRGVHNELLRYFEDRGERVWADYQRSWLEKMKNGADNE